MFRVGADVLLDLHDELARRRQHQRAQPVHVVFLALGSQLTRRGDQRLSRSASFIKIGRIESGGLPRPSLGDADYIVSRENEWNGRNLDWSRLGVTRIPNRL